MLLFFITFIIIIILIIIIYYVIIKIPTGINSLIDFDDEYLSNLRFVPEQIFDYSIGNYSDLINELEELKNRFNMLYNEYNNLKKERNIYLELIEDQNETIMNLRNQIDILKLEIANNTNYLSKILYQ